MRMGMGMGTGMDRGARPKVTDIVDGVSVWFGSFWLQRCVGRSITVYKREGWAFDLL